MIVAIEIKLQGKKLLITILHQALFTGWFLPIKINESNVWISVITSNGQLYLYPHPMPNPKWPYVPPMLLPMFSPVTPMPPPVLPL